METGFVRFTNLNGLGSSDQGEWAVASWEIVLQADNAKLIKNVPGRAIITMKRVISKNTPVFELQNPLPDLDFCRHARGYTALPGERRFA